MVVPRSTLKSFNVFDVRRFLGTVGGTHNYITLIHGGKKKKSN